MRPDRSIVLWLIAGATVAVVAVLLITLRDEGPAPDAIRTTATEDGLRSESDAVATALPRVVIPATTAQAEPPAAIGTAKQTPVEQAAVNRIGPRLPAAAPAPTSPAPTPTAKRFPYTRNAAIFEPKEPGKDKIADPVARLALSLVGADRDAEAYWIEAINDPNLAEQERQDLIEDLNEDGLSDADNPGKEDLPLIENRLRIIEHLLPDAMDKVNVDALLEAQKDLLIMRERLRGGN